MKCQAVVPNARQRVKDAVTAEIIAVARGQLATEGAGTLSLHAVAREMGMASSAIYRYIRHSEFLTALIIEAYDALGEVAEAAATAGDQGFERWQSVCRSIRAWALERPHRVRPHLRFTRSRLPGARSDDRSGQPRHLGPRRLAGRCLPRGRVAPLEATPLTATWPPRLVSWPTLPCRACLRRSWPGPSSFGPSSSGRSASDSSGNWLVWWRTRKSGYVSRIAMTAGLLWPSCPGGPGAGSGAEAAASRPVVNTNIERAKEP